MTYTRPAIRCLSLSLAISVLLLCSACTRFIYVDPDYFLDKKYLLDYRWQNYWSRFPFRDLVVSIPFGDQPGISVSGGATFGQWTAGTISTTTTVQLSSIYATLGSTDYKITDLKVYAGSGPTPGYPSLPTNTDLGDPIAHHTSFPDPYSDYVNENDLNDAPAYDITDGEYWVKVVLLLDNNGAEKRLVAVREFTLNVPYPQNLGPIFPVDTFDEFYWEY